MLNKYTFRKVHSHNRASFEKFLSVVDGDSCRNSQLVKAQRINISGGHSGTSNYRPPLPHTRLRKYQGRGSKNIAKGLGGQEQSLSSGYGKLLET